MLRSLADRSRAIHLPLALTAVLATCDAPLSAQSIDTLALESHARFLSDDLLEGRGPASRGERLASLFIASHLHRFGLEPLKGGAYSLPVPLTAVHVDAEAAAVRIIGNGTTRTLRQPDFYHPGGSRHAFRNFEGELVIAGSAARAAETLRAAGDLTGKVVVLTPPWAGSEGLEVDLHRRGAAGTVQLVPHAAFYERLRVVRGPTRYYLPDGVDDPANQTHLPSIVGGPTMIRALGLEEGAQAENLERARPLGMRLVVELPFTIEERIGHNVAGYVAGTDPELRDEMVVYVAHYDHVGFGEPEDGDSIWNGFVDNAAGSAILLELARAMAADPPPRPVGFLFVTAEEQGLLGSNWFVHEPPIELDRIRAVLNIDGGAPPAPPEEWGLVGAEESAIGPPVRALIEGRGWSVRAVPPGPQSDHWPFHRAGVPTLMLFPGDRLEGLSEQEADTLRARWLRPHTPNDEWSPDFPFSGLRRYAELALLIGRDLAGAPATGR